VKTIQYAYEDYLYPRKIPWHSIFLDLQEQGVTPSIICELIGIEWSSLQRLKSSTTTEPRHSLGEALLKLHRRYCGELMNNQRLDEAE
jgi:hypothetical protein